MSRVVVVAGPTGVGKTRVAIDLALRLDGEIVNYDSVQVYRGFDIGSAKPSVEEQSRVRHHLIDIVEADKPFDAAEYSARAGEVCDRLISASRVPILVGGTGFYLRALLGGLPDLPGRNGEVRSRIQRIWLRPGGPHRLRRWLEVVDPVTAKKVSPRDRHRIERALEVWISSGRPISSWVRPAAEAVRYSTTKIALTVERALLNPLLDERVHAMYDAGLVDETRRLLDRYPRSSKPFQTIGYREAVACVLGEMSREEAIVETCRRTRAYAKRQMTWLRGEPDVRWVDATGDSKAVLERVTSVCTERSSDIVSH